MATNQTQRPEFYEGQYLGAADLTSAVAYSHVQRARHFLGAHTWGIAMGLDLKEKPSPAGNGVVDVFVQPGYAWDGFGRPIVLLSPCKIPAEKFKSFIDNGDPKGLLIEVWLRYEEIDTRGPRPGFELCDREDQYSRVQETFRLEVGERTNHGDRHDPVSVDGHSVDAGEAINVLDPADPPLIIHDESIPHQTFPEDDDEAFWLIPLGCVRWKPGQPGNFVETSDDDRKKSRQFRRYIGVVAGSVQAAGGTIRMRDRTDDPLTKVWSDDRVWVEGNLRVDENIKLFGGKLGFLDVSGQDEGVPLEIQRTDNGQGGRDLRILIGKTSSTENRFAIGPDDVQPFVPKVVVRADGNFGIGTEDPLNSLHVAKPGHLNAIFDNTGDSNHLTMCAGSSFSGLRFTDSNSFIIGSQPYGEKHNELPGKEHLKITSDGNVRVPGKLTLGLSESELIRGDDPGTIAQDGDPNKGLLIQSAQTVEINIDSNDSPPDIFAVTKGSTRTEMFRIQGDGKVGIGTTAPEGQLHVKEAVSSSSNGLRIENAENTRNLRLWIGTSGAVIDAFSGADLRIQTNGNDRLFIRSSNGHVGIGTDAPSELLHVNGKAVKSGGGHWTTPSDKRLKKNIKPLKDALDKLTGLRGISFEWKEPETQGDLTGQQMGLIAQEVEKIFPGWVGTDQDGYKDLTIIGIEALIVEAFKELRANIKDFESRLKFLEKKR